MRVMLFYRALTVGGAERQIVALASGLAKRGHMVSVVTFYSTNPLGEGLSAAGVSLISLGKHGRWDILGFLARFLAEARRQRPDVLYSFLPVSNLIGLAARLTLWGLPIVWGLRTSFRSFRTNDALTRFSYWAEARASRCANLIVCNSHSGAQFAAARGFPRGRVQVVPNGVNTDRFRPDFAGRGRVRAELGIAAGVPLVGCVARLDPVKGVDTFLEAAAMVARANDAARFTVVGGGDAAYRAELAARAERLGIAERVLWLGERADMPDVYNALDLMVLSSPNEGTSNAVLEAMACGTPVVVTDVGDLARSVGAWGAVVPVGDTARLADTVTQQLARRATEGPALAEGCRRWIVENYSLDAMVQNTELLLEGLVRKA